MRSLMKYLNVTYKRGIGSQATREENNEMWRHLNWGNPGEEELKSVTKCLRQQNELLQEDYREGRESSRREHLMNLSRHLWKYLLLDSSTRMRAFSSMYHHGGWTQFDSRPDTTFEQRVQTLLRFLKVLTANRNTQASQFGRYHEDTNSEEFGILTVHPESL